MIEWTGLSPDEARQFLANKDKSKRDKRLSLKEAVQKYVKDGDIGVAGFVSRQPVPSFTKSSGRKKDLTLPISLPDFASSIWPAPWFWTRARTVSEEWNLLTGLTKHRFPRF